MSCGCGCGGEAVAYEDWQEHDEEENATAAEYQGRKVTLNKPFRTPGANKKFGVYTKNESGNVVLVRFGDPNMEIRRDDPERRRNFRSRHNCDNPGPKYKARYWSCRQWRGGSKVEAAEECGCNDVIAKRHDPRSTPAPPKDRKRGSKKNKPGSARPGGKVTFSESVTNSLKNKVSEHNKKSKRKVTLGMLKAVYRRGAGAYSTSHRPGVSRAAWSMARVNAFLRLVRSGSPSNSKYTQDNDLLPSGHPRKSKKASMDYCEDCTQKAQCAEHGGCMKEEKAEAEMIRKDVFDNPGEAMERAKEMGCDEVHSHSENGKTVFMPCKTHEEYRSKNDGEDVEVEGYYDDDKKKKKASYHMGDKCEPGYEKKDGKCVKVAVTLDLGIDNIEAVVEASTGDTIIEIRGVAFHEGMNKNKWELTAEGAKLVADRMVGADVTLSHPEQNKSGAGFTRNMDGSVEEAVVGYINSATFFTTVAGGYEVRYVAHIVRAELFDSLESGLWSREGYGVSIGGSGVPVKADENGIVFDEDFNFDHLAIVHKPAYERANIESVKRIEKPEMFISQSDSGENNRKEMVKAMTDETNEMNFEDEIESLKAELVLASSKVAEFEAAEDARIEEERMALVEQASERGMTGHDDLQADTIRSLIASWDAAHPEPSPVVMEPVESEPSVEETPAVASETPKAVVANFLNGKMVETDEGIYAKAWNAWAKAWNGTLSVEEKARMAAPSYESMKEMN